MMMRSVADDTPQSTTVRRRKPLKGAERAATRTIPPSFTKLQPELAKGSRRERI